MNSEKNIGENKKKLKFFEKSWAFVWKAQLFFVYLLCNKEILKTINYEHSKI
jgi:hypothetical protein